jgi:hypothetical protein
MLAFLARLTTLLVAALAVLVLVLARATAETETAGLARIAGARLALASVLAGTSDLRLVLAILLFVVPLVAGGRIL